MHLRRVIAAVLCLAAAGQALAAAEAGSPEPFAEAVVELRINAQPQAVTLVVRRDVDGTLLVRAADLAGLRLKTPTRGAVQVNGERFYRLGPELGAHVVFDEVTQSCDVTLPAAAFLPTRAAESAADRPALTPTPMGGFVNYDVSAEKSSVLQQGGGFFELGLFGTHGVATQTLVARANSVGERTVARLDTTWTRDFPDRLATLRVGDAISTSGSWGRSVRFGGVQFGTNFGTQPSLVTTPLVAAEGEAVVPSTVDVFVNGRPVASEQVPPGPFTIDHLPVLTGAGQLQVVVTDALGRQQVISQPYYSGASMLRAGLDDYSLELGSVREDYGVDSFDYGDLVGVASWRRGFSDTLTAGFRAEAQGGGSAALGGEVAWQAGRLGIVTAHLAGSNGTDGAGFSAGLGVEHNGERFTLYAQTQYASRDFSQIGLSAFERTPRQRTFAGFGYDLRTAGNVQLVYGLQTFHDADRVQTLGLNYSVTLGTLGYLGLFATHATADTGDTTVLLSWTLPLGNRRTLSTGLQQSSSAGFEAYTTLQRDLPSGSGLGYRVSLSSAEENDASLAWQGSAGTASLEYAERNGVNGARLGATGGLAITGAGVMPARRLERSFAVVQVADFPNLTVFVDNQPIGKTDAHGRVLVDALRPYERNEVSVDPTQVPMDGALAQASMNVTPAYRSGALVRFPVQRAEAAIARLMRPDGTAVPAGAQVALANRSFPVALDGLVYVEGLHGRAQGQAAWEGGSCTFELQRPAGTEPVPDLGQVQCE